MTDWTRVSTGNEWETKYGFSRAIRAGGLVFINGTVALDDDLRPFAPGDAHAQTLRCFEIVERALGELGLDRTAIVRSRVYVTDISRSDEFGRAHAEFFAGHRPCLTMIGVNELISPAFLVEIECDAVAPA